MSLNIRPQSECELDEVSLGECMVRLSPPGHGRVEFASTMEVWVGGGEYNVAYALSRLGLRTGWVGGLVDNPVGRLVENHAKGGGRNADVDLQAGPNRVLVKIANKKDFWAFRVELTDRDDKSVDWLLRQGVGG